MAYLLSAGVEEFASTPAGFINGLWWSKDLQYYNVEQHFPSEPCPRGMVHVQGNMMDDGGLNSWNTNSVEYLQKSTCESWIEKKFPERCAKFNRESWVELSKRFPRRPMGFCIDKYEWPNRKGAYPWVMVTWPEAHELCWSAGKRMCTEDEWTFACEGEEATPYPYGYERNADQCNLDRRWKQYSSTSLASRGSEKCSRELNRLWQGKRSGEMPQCSSSFGVEDMNGSVDEWTTSTRSSKYPSILKGGYWGPVRTRCRPSTRNHGPGHTFYQQGFRCCKDSGIIEGR